MIKKISIFALTISTLCPAADPFSVIRRANRKLQAATTRVTPTQNRAVQKLTPQPSNGDEARYADKRASFGKALPQLSNGLINPQAFDIMVNAFNNGTSDAFLTIPMGTPGQTKLIDPQAALAFTPDGADAWINTIPPAPILTSENTADSAVELYWMALTRDVFFNDYATNPLTIAAATELSTLPAFTGPKTNGIITAQTLFRGTISGCLIGPMISQFLYLPVPNGPTANFAFDASGTPGINFQASIVPISGTINDFMTDVTTWAAIQKGEFPTTSTAFTSTRVFFRNSRDIANYVHQDVPPQTYVNAGLMMLHFGAAALDPNNPFIGNPTQKSFVTYDNPDLCYLLTVATEMALRAAWYQKWMVHRRLRPEFYGFLVHQQKTGAADYGINSDVINSTALINTFNTFGSYLLPQAYPEGCPTHPSYPAAHATIAGACATILKAFFNEDFVIPNPVEPNASNTQLQPYVGEPLTLGNEINKLAANMATARNMAGVHYRSDMDAALNLGEAIGIALLEDEAYMRNIKFAGFKLTKFDGTQIIVGAKKTAAHI